MSLDSSESSVQVWEELPAFRCKVHYDAASEFARQHKSNLHVLPGKSGNGDVEMKSDGVR